MASHSPGRAGYYSELSIETALTRTGRVLCGGVPATAVNSISHALLFLQPSRSASPWQQVDLTGEAHDVFSAYDRLLGVAEEVDPTVVLALRVARERHTKLSGPPSNRNALKLLSAQSGARVFVPSEGDETTAVTFEGSLTQVRAGLALAVRALAPAACEPTVVEFRIPGASRTRAFALCCYGGCV